MLSLHGTGKWVARDFVASLNIFRVNRISKLDVNDTVTHQFTSEIC
jgi:hypothetical protein